MKCALERAVSNFLSAWYIQEQALLLSQMNPLKFAVNEKCSKSSHKFLLVPLFIIHEHIKFWRLYRESQCNEIYSVF